MSEYVWRDHPYYTKRAVPFAKCSNCGAARDCPAFDHADRHRLHSEPACQHFLAHPIHVAGRYEYADIRISALAAQALIEMATDTEDNQ